MPFDAAGFPEEDGACATEPTPVERWLHYVVAVCCSSWWRRCCPRGLWRGVYGHDPRDLASLSGKIATPAAAPVALRALPAETHAGAAGLQRPHAWYP
jgi:hypothetical protein